MTIRVSEEIEARLRIEASRRGVDVETYVTDLITSHASPEKSARSIAELFDEWQTSDHTTDPAELERRKREFEQFKEAMNQNRMDMEGASARKVYP